jgi:hypothetical protein
MSHPPTRKHPPFIATLIVSLIVTGCSSGNPCPSGSSKVGDRCVPSASADTDAGTNETPPQTETPPAAEPEPTCLVANAGAAKTWKPPVRISVENDDKDNAWSVLVANGTGEVLLPYNRYPLAERPDIQYSLYSATGWSAPALLEGDDTRGAGWYRAVGDLRGNFVAVWASIAGSDVVHYTSTRTPSGTWTNPTLLQPWPSSVGTDPPPLLRGNRRGDVMVLLEKGYPQASAVANQIFMYRYSPATLWSQPTAISQVGKVGFWKRGWLGEDGSGLLAWAAGAPEINVKAPSDGKLYTRDLTATGELGVPEEHASTGHEVYKLDASGTLGYRFLAWTNKASDVARRVLYLKTKPVGQAWNAAAPMDLSGDEPFGPVLTSNGRSHAYLMWLAVDKDDSTINRIRVSRWNESTAAWSDPEVISNAGMTIQLNEFTTAVDDAGNYIVSWVQWAASNQSGPRTAVARIYSPASGWGDVTTISQPNRDLEWVHTTMDCGGNATVAWHQRRSDPPPASLEVWAARYE